MFLYQNAIMSNHLEYLEHSLHKRDQQKQFESVIKEYFDLVHAELVPDRDFGKLNMMYSIFYLHLHVVYKASSTTTKVQAVFDASAKSMSGVSLNDHLLIGPTVHPSLVDVLLRFQLNRIAVPAVRKMYRAIVFMESDRDLHRIRLEIKSLRSHQGLSNDESHFWCIGLIIYHKHAYETKCHQPCS